MSTSIFEKEKTRAALAALRPDTPAAWGIMSAQHMVEHLALVLEKFVRHDSDAALLIPEEKVEKAQAWLRDPEKQMPQQFRAPFLPTDSVLPLRHPDLAAAQAALLAEIDRFEAFFRDNPQARPMHPLFGALDRDLWVHLNDKHFDHHFRQFGLR